MAYEYGVRPVARVERALQWEYAGTLYRPITRWFERAANRSLASLAGDYDLAPAAGEKLLVNRVHLILVDPSTGANLWSDSDFGGRAALTTGLTFTLRKSGAQVHDFTDSFKITTNARLFGLTAPDYSRTTLDEGNAMGVATWDFVGSYAPVFLDGVTDILRLNVASADVPLTTFIQVRADCFLIVGDE